MHGPICPRNQAPGLVRLAPARGESHVALCSLQSWMQKATSFPRPKALRVRLRGAIALSEKQGCINRSITSKKKEVPVLIHSTLVVPPLNANPPLMHDGVSSLKSVRNLLLPSQKQSKSLSWPTRTLQKSPETSWAPFLFPCFSARTCADLLLPRAPCSAELRFSHTSSMSLGSPPASPPPWESQALFCAPWVSLSPAVAHSRHSINAAKPFCK